MKTLHTTGWGECKYRLGFTLAEVLITLVVIGIIAAITVPIIQQNTNKKELVVKAKKAYSMMKQAVNAEKADTNNFGSNFDFQTFLKKRIIGEKKLKEIAKITEEYSIYSSYYQTNDGMAIEWMGPSTTPVIKIDVNGDKGPNESTTDAENPKDIYWLFLGYDGTLYFGASWKCIQTSPTTTTCSKDYGMDTYGEAYSKIISSK